MEVTAFSTEEEAVGRKEVWKQERKMKTERTVEKEEKHGRT